MNDTTFTPREKSILILSLARQRQFYNEWLEDLEETDLEGMKKDVSAARDDVSELLSKIKLMPPHIND